MTSLRSRLCMLVAALVVVGCSSAPPPRLLLLTNDVVVPPAPQAKVRPLLVVRAVRLPEYMDRRALVYQSGEAELKKIPDTVWAERPEVAITRWLALQLAADLPDLEVRAFSAEPAGSAAETLYIELDNFEARALPGTSPELRLRGGWHLNGDRAANGRLNFDVTLGSLEPADVSTAMGTAMRQAAQTIADGVKSAKTAG
jgi:uncharacterized lipoprotein YmbA